MSQLTMIDAHLHMFRTKEEGILEEGGYEIWEYGAKEGVEFGEAAGDIEDVLLSIDRARVSCAVTMNFFGVSTVRQLAIAELPEDLEGAKRQEVLEAIDGSMPDRLMDSNLWVCEMAKKYTQLVPFITADPEILEVETAQNHIQDMVENYGAKGLKLHPAVQRFYMHEPRMLRLFETCIDLEVPILAHSGPDRDGQGYSEPSAFAKVLEILPELRLVLAHMGGATWRQLPEFARSFRSVKFDCSEIIFWTGATNGPSKLELAQLIQEVGSERVMMGSDFPAYEIDHTIEQVMELPLLSLEQKEALLGANAIRILNL